MQPLRRLSQLLPREREALLRALFTVFDRPDCRGRALSLPELPPLLAQAGFDASRCSLPLLEDAARLCVACSLTLPAESPALLEKDAIAAQGFSDFGNRLMPPRANRWFLPGVSRAAFARRLLVDAPLRGLLYAALLRLLAR